jgi:hypothetical protein
MTDTVRAVVDIESDTFWKLAAVAEQYEMTVPDYLNELATVASNRKLPSTTDPVAMRWRIGKTDKEIASELAMTNQAVAVRRRSFGFPANRAISKSTNEGH